MHSLSNKPDYRVGDKGATASPQLNFLYLHAGQLGYGAHGKATHEAFERIGVDVYDGLPGSGDNDISNKRSKICKDVLYLSIPAHVPGWWKGQRKHLFTMWETDTLPEMLRENLHNFDTIMVPSQECQKMYSQYHDNVHYIPLGVDTERWHKRERRKADTYFTFLVCGSGKRKGSDLVFKAFTELWPDGMPWSMDMPIPRLIIKSPKGEDLHGNNVEVINGFMSPEEEVELYASAHCYVQPSRGEGWGMQPLQAMAQGCPTILTDAHGHEPFANYGIPIRADKVPAEFMRTFGECGNWWEPDYAQLKQSMFNVYQNYALHVQRAAKQADYIKRAFTWDASAETVIHAMGGWEKLSERWRPDEIPTEWVEPELKKYRIITKDNRRADIGGVTYVFEKGKEYLVPADTKRVLFETKALDPACLDEDQGLAPSQIERIGEYADAFICHACGQKIAQQSDDDNEELIA